MRKILSTIGILILLLVSCTNKTAVKEEKTEANTSVTHTPDTTLRDNIVDTVRMGCVLPPHGDIVVPVYDIGSLPPDSEQEIYFPIENIDSILVHVSDLTTSIEGAVPDISRRKIKARMIVECKVTCTTPKKPGPWEFDFTLYTHEAVKPNNFKVKGVIE